MNKREMIHVLVDKLLDIEESTARGVDFSYCTSLGMRIQVTTSPKNHGDHIRKPLWPTGFDKAAFEELLKEIILINETPDREPEISVKLTESKARELGLLA